MIKKIFLSLGSVFLAGTAMAQLCATDEVNNGYKNRFATIAADEAKLQAEIASQIRQMDLRNVARKGTVDTDTAVMNIPVVVHVMHDYGAEYVSDDQIYTMIREMNELYNKQNAGLSGIIAPFVPLIGNAHIRFRLATVDPNGNATHGITRRRTYLTQGGDDQAKMDYWPQNKYFNIWLINHIGMGAGTGIVGAYSAFPFSAASAPYYDGVIGNYMFINNGSSSNNTYGHEAGHSFFLFHPWNNSGQGVGVACGDDDVLDTPPTKGHYGGCNLYDVTCAVGYANGPDTTNVQNVMDYADCAHMFTVGQVARMRAALRSTTGNRNNLWAAANLTATGALAARPALPPVADFSVSRGIYCVGTTIGVNFVNRSWNDTLNSVAWTFSNGAAAPSSASMGTVTNTFTQTGWATVTLNATGVRGTNAVTRKAVFVLSNTPTSAVNYTEDFTSGINVTKYPLFDYFNTGRAWELATTGFNDNASLRYVNKDTRSGATALASGTPDGDYADFITPNFDLTDGSFTSNCNLTFVTAGAYRTSSNQNDVLEVSYSKNCGLSWIKMDSLKGSIIGNNGVTTADFTPTSASQWASRSMVIPQAARSSATEFRFRYLPGVNSGSKVGTGNNFYLDKLGITGLPTGVNGIELNATGMEIAPNPTSGDAFILLKGAGNGVASVMITDITGKRVYQTEHAINGDLTRIDIPASNIYAKGIYLVKVIAGSKTFTKKLVVN